MRFLTVHPSGRATPTVALQTDKGLLALPIDHAHIVADLRTLIAAGPDTMRLAAATIVDMGDPLDETELLYLPPITNPGKIICVGLNYLDHSAESNVAQPDYPTLFFRVIGSLVGHEKSIICPASSKMMDYEGELVAYIGKAGRNISRVDALKYVAGYSIGNEGTIRDFQFKTSQWTMGKNFDSTGAMGPVFVSAEELPEGGAGLKIETRLNNKVVQSASTDDMVFDLAAIISTISEGISLEPGDVIFTGTPAGVGAARKPPLFMKAGDVVEVEIENIGILRNRVVDEIT